MREKMRLQPIGLRSANAYVKEFHRHSGPTRGHKFSISVVDEHGDILGVAIAGRPVARGLDNGMVMEVLRVCTTSTAKNVCSMLYGACARAAKAMGYDLIVTYTLKKERGASLKASGYIPIEELAGNRQWKCTSRDREERQIYLLPKIRWEKRLR